MVTLWSRHVAYVRIEKPLCLLLSSLTRGGIVVRARDAAGLLQDNAEPEPYRDQPRNEANERNHEEDKNDDSTEEHNPDRVLGAFTQQQAAQIIRGERN